MMPNALARLYHDERAVPPVIGVILMVGITVILAALIAAFVLGFGAEQAVAPQNAWVVEEEPSGGGSGTVTFTHDGGDPVDADQLSASITGDGQVDDLSTSADRLTSGDEVAVELSGVSEGDVINLVWNQAGGDDTAILRQFTLSDPNW